MTILISRIIITAILCYIGFLVWTRNINILTWASNKLESYLPITENKTPQHNNNLHKFENSEDAFILISGLSSTTPINQMFFDLTLFNNTSRDIIIKKMNLLCSGDKEFSSSSSIPWNEETLKLEANSSQDNKIYFGKNKSDLMLTFSFYNGLPFYIALQIIYVTDNGIEQRLLHKYGKLSIKGNLEGYFQNGGKPKIKLK